MAKINEQTLVITVSQLVKDDAPIHVLLEADVVAQLEAVVAELAGSGTLVEIKQA
jgi:D-arabinose 5-phosphate isomerase GutQ